MLKIEQSFFNPLLSTGSRQESVEIKTFQDSLSNLKHSIIRISISVQIFDIEHVRIQKVLSNFDGFFVGLMRGGRIQVSL